MKRKCRIVLLAAALMGAAGARAQSEDVSDSVRVTSDNATNYGFVVRVSTGKGATCTVDLSAPNAVSERTFAACGLRVADTARLRTLLRAPLRTEAKDGRIACRFAIDSSMLDGTECEFRYAGAAGDEFVYEILPKDFVKAKDSGSPGGGSKPTARPAR